MLPDHAEPIRGNPLVLFLDQLLFAADTEKAIKAILRLEQLRFLDVQDGGDFAIAIQAFLIRTGQSNKADNGDQGKSKL